MAAVNEKREKAIKAGRDLLQSSIEIVSGKIAHLHLFNDIMKEEVDEKINAALDSLDELEPHLCKDFPNFEIKLFHPNLFMKREVYTPLDPVEKFQSAEEVIETNDMARAITKNISDFATQADSPHRSASADKQSGSGSFNAFEAVEEEESVKTPPHSPSEMTSKDTSDRQSKHSKKKEDQTQTTSKTKKKTNKKSKESKTRTGKVKKIKKKIKKVLKGNKKSKDKKEKKEKTKKKSKESKKKREEKDETTEKTEKTDKSDTTPKKKDKKKKKKEPKIE